MNFDVCPVCGAALRIGRRKKGTRMILVDHLDTGVSFFVCPDCETAFNPWHPNREPERWKTTQPFVEQYRPCTNRVHYERDM
jgi:uncharacterized protein with PIN domain